MEKENNISRGPFETDVAAVLLLVTMVLLGEPNIFSSGVCCKSLRSTASGNPLFVLIYSRNCQ